MIYTSIENEKIKLLKKLKDKKYRDQADLFLIEGEKIVREAAKTNLLKEVFLLENSEKEFNVKTNHINLKVAKTLSSLETSDYMFGLCKKIKNKMIGNRVLCLDNVQDPGNIGTIIRSALAFNIDTVILKNSCDLYNPKLIRASMGMIFHLNLIEINDEEMLKDLKKQDYLIIGADINGENNIKKVVNNIKFVIIVGNEGTGISKEVLALCDKKVSVLMNSKCESLNVAVATSILLYELDKEVENDLCRGNY